MEFDRVLSTEEAKQLFALYMRLTGTPTLSSEAGGGNPLAGKCLGIINGSSWVSLWATYFGRLILPGVKLVNIGNDAVQLNFMGAHERGEPTPPQSNIDRFESYGRDLADLYRPDAVLISCSTMNRAYPTVAATMRKYGIPAIQIDQAMMRTAVEAAPENGTVLVIATHGPTVKNTQELLADTAADMGKTIGMSGETVEEAFELLGAGKIREHNAAIAAALRRGMERGPVDAVVLAQLSMSVFAFDHPAPEEEFGAPVFTSGECGFRAIRDLLLA